MIKFINAVNSAAERDALIEQGLPGTAPIVYRRDTNSLEIYDVDAAAYQSIAFAGGANQFVAAGSTLTLTVADHNGKTIRLDTLTGSVVTLPASTGGGAKFRFYISVIPTSNSHIVKVANASDTMIGYVQTISDDAPPTVKGFKASGTDDTLTLNRSTTGAVQLGEVIDVEDIALNVWLVQARTQSSGTEATPFSATV